MKNYETQIRAFVREIKGLIDRRDELNKNLIERYASLRGMSAAIGEGWEREPYLTDMRTQIFQAPRVSDGVRIALELSSEPLSPTEIRDRLVDWGYDMRRYTFPMGMVHRILKDMIEAEKIEVVVLRDNSKLYRLRKGSKGS